MRFLNLLLLLLDDAKAVDVDVVEDVVVVDDVVVLVDTNVVTKIVGVGIFADVVAKNVEYEAAVNFVVALVVDDGIDAGVDAVVVVVVVVIARQPM